MDLIHDYLAVIWLVLIAFFLLYYAVADGFDLGVGILSLFQRDRAVASAMMNAVGSVWNGNQTWLVILGGMLFGAFPIFYSILLSALYLPLVVMLLGLIFRGVAFEFRAESASPRVWLWSFGLGSLVATLGQGLALGGLLAGIRVEGDRFAGGSFDWWNGYSVLVAAGVLLGYLMLGANYLILAAEDGLRQRGYRWSITASLLTFPVSLGVHVWTAARYPHAAEKWAAWPSALPVAAPALLAVLCFGALMRSLARRRRAAPLAWNAAVIFLSFLSLSQGLYPLMIPSVLSPLTVHRAAASPPTLLFMLVVVAILLPVILGYTWYTYRVLWEVAARGGAVRES